MYFKFEIHIFTYKDILTYLNLYFNTQQEGGSL
jgi:hypothetical protein